MVPDALRMHLQPSIFTILRGHAPVPLSSTRVNLRRSQKMFRRKKSHPRKLRIFCCSAFRRLRLKKKFLVFVTNQLLKSENLGGGACTLWAKLVFLVALRKPRTFLFLAFSLIKGVQNQGCAVLFCSRKHCCAMNNLLSTNHY